MTTLLLTDIIPSSNYTAGIVTAEMCRAIRPNPLVIFCVQNGHLTPEPYPDLENIPTKVVVKPNEVGIREFRGLRWGMPGSAAIEFAKRIILPPRLVREASAFGRDHGVTRIWAVLQGQTMVRIAAPVARALGVPLHVHVWDPLAWWHKAHLVDPVNAWLDERLFTRTMRMSVRCASASWAMTEHFEKLYGVPGEPVIAALDSELIARPQPRLRAGNELVIGMAGQFYAVDEWRTLLQLLESKKWRVGNRRIVLRAMGRDRPPGDIPVENLDFLGWRSQREAIDILSRDCDILYCPYPFDPKMSDVSQLSFPSKLPTYFCAGRPVLFHGPADSSPGVYVARRSAAWIAGPSIYDLNNALLHLTEDQALYASLCEASSTAFLADFTTARQRATVRSFLSLAP